MQFTTITALLGMLLASAPALASPVENVVARQSPVGTCARSSAPLSPPSPSERLAMATASPATLAALTS